MSRDLLGTLAAWQREFGDVMHLRIWPEHEIIVADPQLARQAPRTAAGLFAQGGAGFRPDDGGGRRTGAEGLAAARRALANRKRSHVAGHGVNPRFRAAIDA
jgi:hypothetical protein